MSTPKNNGGNNSPDYYGKPDPMLLAHTTVEAVEKIGTNASQGLRDAATDVRKHAEAVAAYLELLADDYDREGAKAREALSTFVSRQVSVYETALTMAKSLRGEEPAKDPAIEAVVEGLTKELVAEEESANFKKIASKFAPKQDE